MSIPANIRRQIEDWLARNPGMTKNHRDYQFIVSTVRDQLFEIEHPDPEAPLDWIALVITTSARHTEFHRVVG